MSIVSPVARILCPPLFRRYEAWRQARDEGREWDQRIADVVACPDNARLRRVAGAGLVYEGVQVMHNGLRVVENGYYGLGITRMLKANRGCHEPQEEVVFDAVIRSLRAGDTMIEAGAYWGFYSMWFLQVVPGATVYLIEPETANIEVGRANFRLNGFRGDFTQAYLGEDSGRHSDGTAVVDLASFLETKQLAQVQVLHADVQGFELKVLRGARSLLAQHRIDYLFLSTHSEELHEGCRELLDKLGYSVLASVPMAESYSVDGVLVVHSPLVTPPSIAPPSRRPIARAPKHP